MLERNEHSVVNVDRVWRSLAQCDIAFVVYCSICISKQESIYIEFSEYIRYLCYLTQRISANNMIYILHLDSHPKLYEMFHLQYFICDS